MADSGASVKLLRQSSFHPEDDRPSSAISIAAATFQYRSQKHHTFISYLLLLLSMLASRPGL